MSWSFKLILITSLSAVLVSYFLLAFESNQYEFKAGTNMASETKLNVLLIGGSGAVGQEVIKALAQEQRIQKVTLFLRKNLELSKLVDSGNQGKFSQKIIDFDHLDEKDFQGDFDACISSLGTTRAKSGPDGFYKVDHDYVVNTAKLAQAGGCKHLNLVTSVGANKNSWFLYPQVKGQVEEEVAEMGFPRVSIYRPAVLLAQRQESRPFEKFAQLVLNYVDCWRLTSIETSTVAKAIVRNCLTNSESKVEILTNKDILAIGQK